MDVLDEKSRAYRLADLLTHNCTHRLLPITNENGERVWQCWTCGGTRPTSTRDIPSWEQEVEYRRAMAKYRYNFRKERT